MNTPFQSTTNRSGNCKWRCNESKYGEITAPITIKLNRNIMNNNPTYVKYKGRCEIFLENQVIFIASSCEFFNCINHGVFITDKKYIKTKSIFINA